MAKQNGKVTAADNNVVHDGEGACAAAGGIVYQRLRDSKGKISEFVGRSLCSKNKNGGKCASQAEQQREKGARTNPVSFCQEFVPPGASS